MMHGLMRNLMTELFGPAFLLYYGVAIAAIVAVAIWTARRDASIGLPPMDLPTKPDPYDIAYLRGGEMEVMKVVIVDLIRLGFLKVYHSTTTGQSRVGLKDDRWNASRLSPLQREVFASFAYPLTLDELEQSSLPIRVREYCREYEARLQAERLIRSQKDCRRAVWLTRVAAAVLLTLGCMALLHAIRMGEATIGVTTILLLLALAIEVHVCQPRRLSVRGNAYLTQLRRSFAIEQGQLRPSEETILWASLYPIRPQMLEPKTGTRRYRLSISV